MTNERCIEVLQAIKFMLDKENYSDEVEEALDLAIKALKVMQGIENAYMKELLKTPNERGEPIFGRENIIHYSDGCVKLRKKGYVLYEVEWFLKHWKSEIELLSHGQIKPSEEDSE